jgi:hypothetical protein
VRTDSEPPADLHLQTQRAGLGGSSVLGQWADRAPKVEPTKLTDQRDDEPRKRWWTEDSSQSFTTGDRVRSRGSIGSDFMRHVQPDTRGKVTGTILGALSGEWATVEFENGYTETVRMSALRRDGWF